MCKVEVLPRNRPRRKAVGGEGDLYGQVHVEETPELLSNALSKFEDELKNLSDKELIYVREAMRKCPEQLTKDFKLMFLRCEAFDSKRSAKRFAYYWEKRVEFCGPDLAFLPMTQSGALRLDEKTLQTSAFPVFEEAKEPLNRRVVGFFPARLIDEYKHSNNALIRAIWYSIHAALESKDAQKHGIVVISTLGPLKLSQTNNKFEKMMIESVQGILPVRLAAVHLCRPPTIIRFIWPVVRMFMSKRTRRRVLFHFGSTTDVLTSLESYGLKKEYLPAEVGGDVNHDHILWLEERRKLGK